MSFSIKTPVKSKLTSLQASQYHQAHSNPPPEGGEPRVGSLFDDSSSNTTTVKSYPLNNAGKPIIDATPNAGMSIKPSNPNDLY